MGDFDRMHVAVYGYGYLLTISEAAVTKEEARRFLEDLDFCMTHLVKMEKPRSGRKLACPSCEAARELAESMKIEEAVRLLRGDDPLPTSDLVEWTPFQPGRMPVHGERVYFLCVGFVETIGRAGGKEHIITGKPQYWRKKGLAAPAT